MCLWIFLWISSGDKERMDDDFKPWWWLPSYAKLFKRYSYTTKELKNKVLLNLKQFCMCCYIAMWTLVNDMKFKLFWTTFQNCFVKAWLCLILYHYIPWMMSYYIDLCCIIFAVHVFKYQNINFFFTELVTYVSMPTYVRVIFDWYFISYIANYIGSYIAMFACTESLYIVTQWYSIHNYLLAIAILYL